MMKPSEKRILAKHLDAIAMGQYFLMSAIVEAESIKWLSVDDKAVLRRYRNGNNSGMDHIQLQAVAIKIRGN
jgi:hypothetical protein